MTHDDRRITTYRIAIETAKDLLHEQINDPVNEANPEYTRGILELIADCFGKPGVTEVANDIGVRLEGRTPPRDYVEAWADEDAALQAESLDIYGALDPRTDVPDGESKAAVTERDDDVKGLL